MPLMSNTASVHEAVLSVRYRELYLRAIEVSGPKNKRVAVAPIVVFLPAGLKYSAGPGRLFVQYARKLAKDGCLCYRFDPVGIGISDGSLKSGSLWEVWNFIENGGFVEELAHFVQQIRNRHPERKIIVCGLCGGAITGILLADRYRQLVDGVISINIEPFFSATLSNPATDETVTRINSVMKSYVAKICSGAAWRRLLSLQSDIRGILRISTQFMLQNRRRNSKELQDFENLNRPLAAAFTGMQRNETAHLMLFAEHSKCWHNFQETFFSFLMGSKTTAPFQELRVIRQANHELQFKEWRDEAFGHIDEWLKRNFFPK